MVKIKKEALMARDVNLLKMAFIIILLTLLPAGVAIGMGSSPRAPQIRIEGQEANLSPVMLGVGSVFLKIENSGSGDDNLVSARISIPDTVVELHDVKGGRMAKVEKIPIPSGSVVELKPKSLHIMIFKIPADIKEGYGFTLYMMFEKSGEKQVPLRFAKSTDTHKHSGH